MKNMEPHETNPGRLNSAPVSYSLDDTPIIFVIGGQEITLDLVEVEIFLENIDINSGKPQEWVPKIQEYIKNRVNVDLTYSQAYNLSEKVRYAYLDYKKKSVDELRSGFTSAATLLGSMTENSNSSKKNSQDSSSAGN